MHAALETCVCPRDVIAPFCRRWRDIDSSLSLSLSFSRVSAFREWKARPEINWTWNERIERVGEKFEYLSFFLFSSLLEKRTKGTRREFERWANLMDLIQVRCCTSRFSTRDQLLKISFHIRHYPPRNSISRFLEICHKFAPRNFATSCCTRSYSRF